jgi:hypothetical protein
MATVHSLAIGRPAKRLWRWPKLPPEIALHIAAVLFGVIITLIQAEILARAATQAAKGIALLLGY